MGQPRLVRVRLLASHPKASTSAREQLTEIYNDQKIATLRGVHQEIAVFRVRSAAIETKAA